MENKILLDSVFFALSDQKRRLILEQLSEGPKTVGDLSRNFDLTISAISKNIKILEAGELIYKTKKGRSVYCHMNFDVWKDVAQYISMHAKFWENRLNELEGYISGKMFKEDING